MNVTLRQLRYFVEIARSRSFSRASEHLNIAQPALSQNISSLEQDLGSPLFERRPRGVELTAAGHRLLASATELLARADALKEDIVDGGEARPTGAVRLWVAGSLAGTLVAPLFKAVAAQCPGVELTVREGLSFEASALVESGQAHLAVMPSPSELLGMESLPIFEERFMLFGAYAAMRRKPREIAFSDVCGLPLAQPDRAHDLRKIIERAANAIDRRLDVRYELNSPAMLVGVVKEGLAFSIMPPSPCHEAVTAKAIAGRPVVGPELSRVQAVVWPRDRPLSTAAAAVRDMLVKLIREMVRDGRLEGRLIGASHKKK
ncbi:LysR family transcriptional regulator, nitrogen assimilation regulatory protein [Variovorax sp. OK605]|jgi:LysR family nitrogen assimilation transcriptional regulator|uniref:LysR family transcriptional regulator n=1 Tax=Variovorax sp. OK605 TaxID=1855317 RepID=UPI0008E7C307|nr:LysR family transcriptional regulator [Variovorax sp. OK605]SFQ62569.1 LysR family transcriptional regulator, nitrogen assimilation regulatory protein [Variovorax sp. OK605]